MADLKKKIQETQGHIAENQKLIFSGEDLLIASQGHRMTQRDYKCYSRQNPVRWQDHRILGN